MITEPPQRNAHLASAWVGGVTVAVLVVGGLGAMQPLLPRMDSSLGSPSLDEEVTIAQFDPPPTAPEDKPKEPQQVDEPDIEIPPLPVIQAPLKPPEMVELTPLEEPSPPRVTTPPPARPKPQVEPKRTTPTGGNADGAPVTFTGGGSGRFPAPPYPAAARAARQEGSVRVLVTVEADGVPSSVSVQSSSGSATLDVAARDQISRRWRWPAGAVRRYIVPVRFVLKP